MTDSKIASATLDSPSTAIGGYYELELPPSLSLPYPCAKLFQSARAAFVALLKVIHPSRVWMPRYICNAMLAPLERLRIECGWYDLNDGLAVANPPRLKAGEYLLYVNYFGVCSVQTAELMDVIHPEQLLLDHSQAFFDPPANCLATLYSPRKFFGVPDGGLLVSHLDIPQPETIDDDSINRMSHLISRLASGPEAGYAAYQAEEDTLRDMEPKTMSWLTRRILSSIDFAALRKRRRENFSFLHEAFKLDNMLSFNASDVISPLCYPLLQREPSPYLRQWLIQNKVFVPQYWPDCLPRANAVEKSMSLACLPLPCDHRYGPNELNKVIGLVADYRTGTTNHYA